MKRNILVVSVLFLTVACNAPRSQVIDAQNMEVTEGVPEAALAPENTPLPAEINAPIVDAPSLFSIEMLDEVHGWGTSETQVLRTNDGGVTWYDVTPAGLTQVGYVAEQEFLDSTHAWIQIPDPDGNPERGTFYRTSDGGLTWATSLSPFSMGDLAFIDQNNGWMMADFGAGAGSNAIHIFQTSDGGVIWTQTFTNNPAVEGSNDSLPLSGIKYGISPLNMQTAWIHGVVYAQGSVYLYRTDDGGKTWFHINLPLSAEAELGDLSVDNVRFFSPTEGALSLRIGTDILETVVYTTADGGHTWQLAPAKLPNSGELDMVSAQEMIFYNRDQFYVTKDAAQTWSIIPPDVSFGDNFVSMSFANSNTGWVITNDASDHRSLYKTTDGGLTWFPIIP